ncbi:efflux RND transporter periplasmic adaptor subunit [Croceivirga lutea]|uniref:efflux RND transporter periplasmic adaptor subunit n=1 Tax=Croceivirga lutea TaxID=1775167 RepID=UPI0016398A43|nr:efflux RND transporter periplasmic adaptor subunit [Croceivirga lutea]
MTKVFFVLFIVFLVSCGNAEESIYPTRTRLVESVYASATIQPDSLYQVHSAVAGILDKIYVEEGDTISKGAPLFQIINTTPKLNTENAKLALQLAQENFSGNAAVLSSLEDEIKTALLSLTNDSLNFYRQKRLWDQQIGSKTQFENQKLAYEISQNNLKLLKSKYERTKNELSTQIKQARNNYLTSQVNTQDFTVTSKISGKVYAINRNPGELVSTLEPIAIMGSANQFIIQLLVDEVDIVRIRKGQKTLLVLDAYVNQVFRATVHKIYPKKDERSQTFTVEAVFDNPPKILYPGLAGEGNIIVAEKESVLTIPKTYIIGGTQVKTENGLVEVQLGLQDLESVEIVAGIDENTKILKPKE